jgi:hypothetical protein
LDRDKCCFNKTTGGVSRSFEAVRLSREFKINAVYYFNSMEHMYSPGYSPLTRISRRTESEEEIGWTSFHVIS